MPLPNFSLINSQGQPYHLSDYQGQLLLIVNTASQCGFRSQFAGLEALYQEFKDADFTVIGFPSNQFKQESVTNENMASTCQRNFGVSFPLNEIVEVNGPHSEALFKWLKQEKGGLFNSDIKWNFTKFLIDRKGEVVKRYPPTTLPSQIRSDIRKLLN